MSTYMTEEQQIERVKDLWKKYGNIITNLALVLVVCVAAWQFWQTRELGLHEKASILYQEMMVSVMADDASGIEAYGKRIVENFPKSIYAHFAEFQMARIAVDKSEYDNALQHLKHVRETTTAKPIKQIARVREARVLVGKKQYQQAIELLKTVDDEGFLSMVAQTRGDIYYEQGKKQQAREQYQLALNKLPESEMLSSLLKMKLNHIPEHEHHVVESHKGAKA